MIDPKKYGTAAEVARKIGVDPSTLHRAIQRGDVGEAVKTCGGTKLYAVTDAKRWKRETHQPRSG